MPAIYGSVTTLPLAFAASVAIVTGLPLNVAIFDETRLRQMFPVVLKLVMSYHAASPYCREEGKGTVMGGGGGSGGDGTVELVISVVEGPDAVICVCSKYEGDPAWGA